MNIIAIRRVRLLLVAAVVSLVVAACSAQPTTAPEPVTLEATAVPATQAPQDTPTPRPALTFDGATAYDYLTAQTDIGPRYPGSEGHLQVRELMVSELEALGWEVERQTFNYQGFEAVNVIGRNNTGRGLPVIILGAHYDTRARADESPGQEDTPVLGAVDGASGVAVLLELARVLDMEAIDQEIWLAFFDVEDNGSGGIEGWNWIAGSQYMATNLETPIEAMVLVDMIGDADQQLYYEGNSDAGLSVTLWDLAAELGFGDSFIPELKYTMIDDHVPFRQRGIPAVDIIDFDYPYWHTVEDTPDKASAESLYTVGRTIEVWLEERGAAFERNP